ncbi:hypothetical protein [Caldimonas tepidiphila]|uniref:hypothetical protein n=1 Tax=Caldimonas tepidiphila TaxID=2315841 RepID=UPI00130062DB|nr:hypothetical protein [Caldimonas tepidiphila]
MVHVKSEQLGVQITPVAKALLPEAAARKRRSISNMVEHLIYEYGAKNNVVIEAVASSEESEESGSPIK